MIIYLSLLVCLLGLLVYTIVKNNPELKEVGRLMFFAGLLAFLLLVSGSRVLPVLR